MGKFSSIEPVPGATKAGDRCCRGKGRYERGCQGAPDNRQERQWDRPRSRGSGDPWPPPGPPQPCTLRRAAQSGTREFPGSPTGLTKLCSRQRTASSFQGGLPGGLVWSLPASAENEAWTLVPEDAAGQRSTVRRQLLTRCAAATEAHRAAAHALRQEATAEKPAL